MGLQGGGGVDRVSAAGTGSAAAAGSGSAGAVGTGEPGGGRELLAPEERASWAALLMLHRTVLQEMDTELAREHNLVVSEFDVLITLSNAPRRRLGMSALARGAMLSPAGTTHLVTRLERDGLVERVVDPVDRRKWYTVLTDRGDRRLRAARLTYDAVLRRRFLAVTTPAERQVLEQLWQRLEQARPGVGQPGRLDRGAL